jgi:acetyl-CoA carboxylase biotin carboxyl carrier protein
LSKRKSKSPAQPRGGDGTDGAAAAGGGPMDVAALERLVKLMRANDLSCLEVADGDRRILLKRGGDAALAPAPSPPTVKPPIPVEQPPAEDAGLIAIKAVMVGTFYAAPGPDSAPFVQVGAAIEPDTDVCVIEAMKVFNTIKAECRGTIAKILAANGQAVEFGQTLFLVKP